ncbi:DNA/RNA non-specific endonuclease [Hymenobacter sp. BT770]|uniref:DNA/RNA non-specific endonuclease n=1 Tax=Hymenobacter sp. BT770 TaxID=2886942 RepID=UPI001D10AA7F|nr:DNA/RNA non-specific endonuclease [Hymenobacter sp. BT770]MCC3155418.1 DNA/RNA non-specific endonuclease [Hymenobacter sp. BT770]MDO3417451.1 DNA/RNA non-specific endonuclease [Hymenobacter sp. BT770]
MPKFLHVSFRSFFLLWSLSFQVVYAARPAARPAPAALTQETFDTGTKTDYSAGTVALATGNWVLTDAVLGNAPEDHRNGAQAVRLQQSGKLTMDFFLPSGAGSVTVQHAIYGTDASSSWELWAQAASCNCNKWTKVGNTVFTTTGALTAVSFTVNIAGNVKFEIRKTSGGPARLNIDDVAVTDFGGAQQSVDNDNLALGNPSGATTDISYPNNYLLVKPQYTVGYNRDQGKPNWVSWHLDISDRGSADRQDDFRNDTSLPDGWYQVLSTSYVGTGFDRGHNCPSADRTSTLENNSATFFMTNMMPQAPNNNQQTWGDLEGYTRTLVGQGNEVYVICGSYGIGGTGSNGGVTNTIDNGRITVPNRTWKVIVVLPVGDNDVSRISAATRIIAVDLPNTNTIDQNWGTYRTTVDAIEAATGYDLLSKLPVNVQAAIESTVDGGPVQ